MEDKSRRSTVEGLSRRTRCGDLGGIREQVQRIGDHALRVQPAPHRIGFHADADQVVARKAVKRLLAREPHQASPAPRRRVWERKTNATAVASTIEVTIACDHTQ